MAESRAETSQPSKIRFRILVALPAGLVCGEPAPMCISANAKLNIDDAMLSYFGYGCGWDREKFQFLSIGGKHSPLENSLFARLLIIGWSETFCMT
jgi:hypothetical protein